MTAPIQHAVIVGTGFAPFLTALFLQKKLRHLAPKISIIESGTHLDEPIISSLSSLKQINAELGFSELTFVKQCQASFNVGSLYTHTNVDETGFLLCESPYGFNLQGSRFSPLFNRYLESGAVVHLDDFSLAAQMAKSGRFTPPSENPRSVFSNISYGYRFQASRYRQYLCKQLDDSVDYLISEIAHVESIPGGAVTAVTLGNGQSVAGDLFIDCSAERLLKSPAQPDSASSLAYVSFGAQLSYKHTLQAGSPSVGPPYDLVQLGKGSLIQTIQIMGSRMVKEIRAHCDQEQSQPSNILDVFFDPEPWQANCIALGAAFSNRPPIWVDQVHTVTSALLRLLSLWPTSPDTRLNAKLYNDNSKAEFESILDSDSLHLASALNLDTAQLRRGASHRLQVFLATGRIPSYESETLRDEQWVALMHALGHRSSARDAVAEQVDIQWLCTELGKIKATFAQAVKAVPTHEHFHQSAIK